MRWGNNNLFLILCMAYLLHTFWENLHKFWCVLFRQFSSEVAAQNYSIKFCGKKFSQRIYISWYCFQARAGERFEYTDQQPADYRPANHRPTDPIMITKRLSDSKKFISQNTNAARKVFRSINCLRNNICS